MVHSRRSLRPLAAYICAAPWLTGRCIQDVQYRSLRDLADLKDQEEAAALPAA